MRPVVPIRLLYILWFRYLWWYTGNAASSTYEWCFCSTVRRTIKPCVYVSKSYFASPGSGVSGCKMSFSPHVEQNISVFCNAVVIRIIACKSPPSATLPETLSCPTLWSMDCRLHLPVLISIWAFTVSFLYSAPCFIVWTSCWRGGAIVATPPGCWLVWTPFSKQLLLSPQSSSRVNISNTVVRLLEKATIYHFTVVALLRGSPHDPAIKLLSQVVPGKLLQLEWLNQSNCSVC